MIPPHFSRPSSEAIRRGPRPGWPEREGDDSLLDERRQLVGHLRPPTLPRSQHLQPVPVDLRLPAVVGRAMHAEGTTRLADRGPAGEIEQLQPVAEEHVIMRHATQLLSLGGEGARLSRKSDSAPASAGALSRSKPYRSPNCRENSETVQLRPLLDRLLHRDALEYNPVLQGDLELLEWPEAVREIERNAGQARLLGGRVVGSRR